MRIVIVHSAGGHNVGDGWVNSSVKHHGRHDFMKFTVVGRCEGPAFLSVEVDVSIGEFTLFC